MVLEMLSDREAGKSKARIAAMERKEANLLRKLRAVREEIEVEKRKLEE